MTKLLKILISARQIRITGFERVLVEVIAVGGNTEALLLKETKTVRIEHDETARTYLANLSGLAYGVWLWRNMLTFGIVVGLACWRNGKI